MKLKRSLAALAALAMLFAPVGRMEELSEAITAELAEVEEFSPQAWPEEIVAIEEPPAEPYSGEDAAEADADAEPDEAAEDPEASACGAPEVIVEPGWEYDAEIGAITIPYTELPEALRFEWSFDGDAAGYAVQTAPVPEGDAQEVRSERVYTGEAAIELPAADYAEGGWYTLYVTAILEDGAEIEGWRYFRLEQREGELGVAAEAFNAGDTNPSGYSNPSSFTKRRYSGQWLWPLGNSYKNVSSWVGGRKAPAAGASTNHHGTDIPAPEGTKIYAARGGKAVNMTRQFPNFAKGLGNWVVIDHGDGWYTAYGHMSQFSSIFAKGNVVDVKTGDVIGQVGHTGTTSRDLSRGDTGDHVHFEIAYNWWGGGYYMKYGYTWDATWGTKGWEVVDSSPNSQSYTYTVPSATPVTSVKLSETSVSRDYSQSAVLKATVSPAGASQGVTWSTSNANVAKISATSGGSIYVWAINPGTATITCASTADASKKASCTFKVNSPSTLQLTGVDYPSTYVINANGYYLTYGTLASNANLKSLTSVIKNSSGGVIGSAYTKSFSGGVKRYDIKGIDSSVPFSKITSAGSYTWTLTGSDVSGRSVTLSLKFNAVKSGNRVISGAAGAYAPIPVSSISLSKASVALNRSRGETVTLTATVLPANAANKSVKWTSSNGSVASVSNGKITPVGKGSATITCVAADGSGAKATCAVTVSEDVKVSAISLSKASVALNRSRGETATLTATVLPANAANKSVKWTSSNGSVASVSNGKITPVGRGSATITCTAADGSGAKATCAVTVSDDVKVSSIALSRSALTLKVGASEKLTASLSPADATNKGVRWSSGNSPVATVDSSGRVSAVAPGSATITCAAADGSGAKATCAVVVEAEGVRFAGFSEDEVALTEGETCELDIVTDPAEARSQLLKGAAVTVVGSCIRAELVDGERVRIRALSAGSADCVLWSEMKDANGRRISLTCKVTVEWAKKPSKVIVAPSTGDDELAIGASVRLEAAFRPEGAWSELRWSSSNKKIATVDERGRVTGHKAGTATITAKASYGGKKGSFKIRVFDPTLPTGVELSESGTVRLSLYGELQLEGALQPDTAQSELKWSSSNKKVASVDECGTVVPKKTGTATITVKTRNGKKDSVKVKVFDPLAPERVELEESGTLALEVGDEWALSAVITPDTASGAQLTWTSSNRKVATVDALGNIVAKKKGSATITVKAKNGKKDSVKVKVR